MIEIKKIREILNHIKKDSYIFFDLDNTLVTSKHDFGSEKWENSLKEEYILKGMDDKKAFLRASLVWRAIQVVSPLKLIEEEFLEIFENLKSQNIKMFGLTARSEDILDITYKSLKELGICFNKFIEDGSFKISENAFANIHNGIIFCSGIDKSIVLKRFLKSFSLKPNHMIVVDNLKYHLENIKNYFQNKDVEITGLRYGFLDEEMKNYKPDEMTDLIHKIITNEKAIDFLKRALIFSEEI